MTHASLKLMSHVAAGQTSAAGCCELKSLVFEAQAHSCNFKTNHNPAYQLLLDTIQSLLRQPYLTLKSRAGKKRAIEFRTKIGFQITEGSYELRWG